MPVSSHKKLKSLQHTNFSPCSHLLNMTTPRKWNTRRQIRVVRSVIGYCTYKPVLSTIDWVTAITALGMNRIMPRAKLGIEMHTLSLSDEMRRGRQNYQQAMGLSSRLHYKILLFSRLTSGIHFLLRPNLSILHLSSLLLLR